ncbi:MAG: DUF262 domain-containing protein [Ignavibacteriales bacterium]|nr:DUF262 domain-containing protein [Ignavibacteriales bacterium]
MPKLTRTHYSVRELTRMFAKGDIAIPEIQRDFVWDAKRIRSLIDSVNRDYPSGAIILWRPEFRKKSEFEMLIRPERLKLYKDRLPTYLLLDGQQRLTALCSVILPAEEVMSSLGEEIDLPKLFINIKNLKIESRKDLLPPSNNHALLNRVLSEETEESGLTGLLKELKDRNDILPKHHNLLKDFRDGILQYVYPVQVLEDCKYETVSDIFKRVNSQGKILVTAELELATIVPHWKGFSKHLRSFIREMKGEGFIADLPFYMKCLAFIATDWPVLDYFSKQVLNGEFKKSQLERFWRLTKQSIRRLNRILERNHINRMELITTRNALVPIVYAIARDKRKRIEDGLFVKYLVYAMVGGHYVQQTEGVLKRDSYPLTDSKRIDKGFKKLYNQMTRRELSSKVFDESDFQGIAAKNPALLSMYLGLVHAKARDFSGKNSTPTKQLDKYQIHHIFPVEFMLSDEAAMKYTKKKKLSRAEFKLEINDVANLTFISLEANQEIKKRPPYDYLPKMCPSKNLAAHCIPKDADLWKPQNFDKFCTERRRMLARAMNAYVRSLS